MNEQTEKGAGKFFFSFFVDQKINKKWKMLEHMIKRFKKHWAQHGTLGNHDKEQTC